MSSRRTPTACDTVQSTSPGSTRFCRADDHGTCQVAGITRVAKERVAWVIVNAFSIADT
ncbi:MAG TPA: hypothetical protein VJ436_04810 [Anaerolineales bacterium]|nr:hypothetical protein [Anaerolineales bacterium]